MTEHNFQQIYIIQCEMDTRVGISLEYLWFVIHRLIEIVGRWIFLLRAYLSGPSETTPRIENDCVILRSLNELSVMIRQKKISSEDTVKAYIERIKRVQPMLNCMTEDRFDEALKEARECDAILNSSNAASIELLAKTKPFFGVPFTTKDSIGVKGMKLTGGLLSRRNVRADEDAVAIKLIREAGAIPLAITNIPELTMWWESSNYIYGATCNPYNTWHTSGGSSGGEGSLLAAGGSCFGIGSDIGGSIRIPSFCNGIFGHKPSTGIVSNDGQFPPCATRDQERLLTTGPMCRYAADLKPILRVLAGDNVSKLKLDTKVDISKFKFYYMEDDGGAFLVSPVSPDIKKAMNEVILHLKENHKVHVEKVNIGKMKKSFAISFANLVAPKDKNMASGMNDDGPINFWWEFLKWATFSGQHTFFALLVAMCETLGPQYDTEKRNGLLKESRELYEEFHKMLGEDGVFLYPTHPTPAPLHNESLLKPINFTYTSIINCLGLPATACPLGFSNGLPIGIQVVADLYQDHLTLAIAEELERKFGGWVPPGTNKIASNTTRPIDSKKK